MDWVMDKRTVNWTRHHDTFTCRHHAEHHATYLRNASSHAGPASVFTHCTTALLVSPLLIWTHRHRFGFFSGSFFLAEGVLSEQRDGQLPPANQQTTSITWSAALVLNHGPVQTAKHTPPTRTPQTPPHHFINDDKIPDGKKKRTETRAGATAQTENRKWCKSRGVERGRGRDTGY